MMIFYMEGDKLVTNIILLVLQLDSNTYLSNLVNFESLYGILSSRGFKSVFLISVDVEGLADNLIVSLLFSFNPLVSILIIRPNVASDLFIELYSLFIANLP
jgi:hypothetical protein